MAPLKPADQRRALVLACSALVLGGTATAWWWHREQRAAIVAAAVPAPPDLAGWPAALRDRIAAAMASSRAGDREGIRQLSALYHANGFFAAARASYEALEQLEPHEPRWWHRHAAILAGFGETDAALRRAEQAVKLAPDYVPAGLRLADILLKRGETERAAAIYREILRSGEHPHALLALARLDVEARNWAEARPRLERVVALTNYELGYDLIVTVYEQLGLNAQAAQIRGRAKASGAYRDPPDPWLDELTELCFDAYRLSLAAGVAQRTGRLADALRLLERATALTPDDVSIRFQLAQTLVQNRDLKRARAEFERCTASAPEFPDAWAHLAALFEQTGDVAAAERTLTAALVRCPDSPGLHLMRARFHRRAGRVPAAVESYRRSIQLRPNEAEPYIELATLLLQGNATEEALRQLHAALEAEPDHPTALTLLALTAISRGDEPAAGRWLARVQAQPRIAPAQAEQLLAAYRGQFGKK